MLILHLIGTLICSLGEWWRYFLEWNPSQSKSIHHCWHPTESLFGCTRQPEQEQCHQSGWLLERPCHEPVPTPIQAQSARKTNFHGPVPTPVQAQFSRKPSSTDKTFYEGPFKHLSVGSVAESHWADAHCRTTCLTGTIVQGKDQSKWRWRGGDE